MIQPNDPINVISHPVSSEVECSGLTKREYLAAMAMQGLLAGTGDWMDADKLAATSVRYSDALIAELNK